MVKTIQTEDSFIELKLGNLFWVKPPIKCSNTRDLRGLSPLAAMLVAKHEKSKYYHFYLIAADQYEYTLAKEGKDYKILLYRGKEIKLGVVELLSLIDMMRECAPDEFVAWKRLHIFGCRLTMTESNINGSFFKPVGVCLKDLSYWPLRALRSWVENHLALNSRTVESLLFMKLDELIVAAQKAHAMAAKVKEMQAKIGPPALCGAGTYKSMPAIFIPRDCEIAPWVFRLRLAEYDKLRGASWSPYTVIVKSVPSGSSYHENVPYCIIVADGDLADTRMEISMPDGVVSKRVVTYSDDAARWAYDHLRHGAERRAQEAREYANAYAEIEHENREQAEERDRRQGLIEAENEFHRMVEEDIPEAAQSPRTGDLAELARRAAEEAERRERKRTELRRTEEERRERDSEEMRRRQRRLEDFGDLWQSER